MTNFKIPINWQSYGIVEIEAESLDEAVDEINLNSDEVILPKDWMLEEGSIEINFEVVEELNPGYKLNEEPQRRELEAKDFGIKEKKPLKVEEVCDDEEREARRHLDQMGEGYEQDSEDEGSEDEG